jgi:hypothetical protein
MEFLAPTVIKIEYKHVEGENSGGTVTSVC